jgi:hypothetical protein
VLERYAGVFSRWTVYEMTRTGTIPHRKHAGRRELVFLPDELDAWDDGASLETFNVGAGGRVCRPILGVSGQ